MYQDRVRYVIAMPRIMCGLYYSHYISLLLVLMLLRQGLLGQWYLTTHEYQFITWIHGSKSKVHVCILARETKREIIWILMQFGPLLQHSVLPFCWRIMYSQWMQCLHGTNICQGLYSNFLFLYFELIKN